MCTMDKGPVPAVTCLCKPGTTQKLQGVDIGLPKNCLKSWEKDMFQYLFLQDTSPDLKQHDFFFKYSQAFLMIVLYFIKD